MSRQKKNELIDELSLEVRAGQAAVDQMFTLPEPIVVKAKTIFRK